MSLVDNTVPLFTSASLEMLVRGQGSMSRCPTTAVDGANSKDSSAKSSNRLGRASDSRSSFHAFSNPAASAAKRAASSLAS